jgi:hypothetical protein
MSSRHILRSLSVALAVGFGVTAFPALADTPALLPPRALTAANLERAIDPLMAEWIDNHKGPGAVVVVVTRDAQIFARGMALRTSRPGSRSPQMPRWCGRARFPNSSPASP